MSASSMPQVGPAMICASSTTLIPFNGPMGMPLRAESGSRASPALEQRLFLGEKGAIADLEVLGSEAREPFVVLLRGERLRVAQAARELLVPARDERRAVGDALRGGE